MTNGTVPFDAPLEAREGAGTGDVRLAVSWPSHARTVDYSPPII